ncbi:MAG: hypothetical protein FWC87_12320 [Acidimicrobiaceae bacterium]|nr:hypothetical protein [Acidimicrobiaceae bacterium]
MAESRISYRRRAQRAGLVGLTLMAGVGLLASTPLSVPVAGASPTPAASANGEAGKTALAILADAKHATEKARTAEVVGSIHHYGSNLSLDIAVGHGQGGGIVSDSGASFDIVLHKPKVYLKAPKATWTKFAGAAVGGLLANRWLQTTTANKDFTDIAQVVDIVKLTNELLTPSGKVVKKGTTTFHGQPAIALTDSGPNGGTLYVAGRGAPYVLGAVGGKRAPGHLTFSDYGSAKVPPAPKNAINLDALEAGAGAGGGGSTTTVPASPAPAPSSTASGNGA